MTGGSDPQGFSQLVHRVEHSADFGRVRGDRVAANCWNSRQRVCGMDVDF